MAVGDSIVIEGIVFEVVFDGRQSLIGDYSRQSTLSDICRDDSKTLQQRHKATERGRWRSRSKATYDRAKQDLKRMGLR